MIRRMVSLASLRDVDDEKFKMLVDETSALITVLKSFEFLFCIYFYFGLILFIYLLLFLFRYQFNFPLNFHSHFHFPLQIIFYSVFSFYILLEEH